MMTQIKKLVGYFSSARTRQVKNLSEIVSPYSLWRHHVRPPNPSLCITGAAVGFINFLFFFYFKLIFRLLYVDFKNKLKGIILIFLNKKTF